MIRKIVISLAAIMGLCALAAAQDLIVSGSVTDPEGYPLDGATVLIKGTARGVSTDSEGRYELSVPSDAVLIASYLGYLSQEKPVGGSGVVNFILSEDTAYLDDVIVVAYGTMSKSDFTGSATQVSGDEIAQASRSERFRESASPRIREIPVRQVLCRSVASAPSQPAHLLYMS